MTWHLLKDSQQTQLHVFRRVSLELIPSLRSLNEAKTMVSIGYIHAIQYSNRILWHQEAHWGHLLIFLLFYGMDSEINLTVRLGATNLLREAFGVESGSGYGWSPSPSIETTALCWPRGHSQCWAVGDYHGWSFPTKTPTQVILNEHMWMELADEMWVWASSKAGSITSSPQCPQGWVTSQELCLFLPPYMGIHAR